MSNDPKAFKRQLERAFRGPPPPRGDEYQRILAAIRRREARPGRRSDVRLSLVFCALSLLVLAATVYVAGGDDGAQASGATTAAATSTGAVSPGQSLYDADGDLGRDYDSGLERLATVIEGSRKF